MRISFDPAKSERNRIERGLPFERAAEFDSETALVREDARRDYGEQRWLAFGLIGERVHALCYLDIIDGIRVISLRKANRREVEAYERARATNG